MISRCPTPLAHLVLVQEDHPRLPELLRHRRGDALVVQGSGGGRGTYALLGAADASQRVVFPARWLSARLPGMAASSTDDRVLALARGDASLLRLRDESALEEMATGMVRPDQPLVLLGVPTDVLDRPGSFDAQELRRRAEFWIAHLGRDRVALAAPVGDVDHPLARLAHERDLPWVSFVEADDAALEELPVAGAQVPLLWTDFQLDREYRLPDDAYVPGLRDLLHRGSLLRERTLYDRLPEAWLDQAATELRILHEWHLGPLLRRVASLMQTLAPVRGARVEAPLSGLEGVCAYLLGLSDERPVEGLDGRTCARALAVALGDFDRHLVVRVEAGSRGSLRQRLGSWAEGGHLALCAAEAEKPGEELRFCFSGQPLWTRTPLHLEAGGFPRVDLSSEDLRALGWFELRVVATPSQAAPDRGADAEVHEFFTASQTDTGQLHFDLPELSARQA